jgi:hypothetical protein
MPKLDGEYNFLGGYYGFGNAYPNWKRSHGVETELAGKITVDLYPILIFLGPIERATKDA